MNSGNHIIRQRLIPPPPSLTLFIYYVYKHHYLLYSGMLYLDNIFEFKIIEVEHFPIILLILLDLLLLASNYS